MPFLKPKETTETLMAGRPSLSPKRRSISPRSLAVERAEVSSTYSERLRTGSRAVRSKATASARDRPALARGWLRRVSL